MRVLWFTNIIMPDAAEYLGWPAPCGNGWWMVALLNHLKHHQLELGVVCSIGGKSHKFKAKGVDYFIVPTPIRRAILNRLGHPGSQKPSDGLLETFAGIVKAWKPDVIHVHGTEREYGLVRARNMTDVPTMVSIQGLIQVCRKKVFGELQQHEIYGRFPFRRRQSYNRMRKYEVYAPIEKEILRNVDLVAGRTDWDQAWARSCNPAVRYRHIDEIMRTQFYEEKPWDLKNCARYRVFTTSGNQPLKGIHVLIEAIHFLKPLMPDIQLKVASQGFGNKSKRGYACYVRQLVQRYDLMNNVEFLGWIDADALAENHRQAHCFVIPSFIENGCNALQEAMLMGTPCIASYAGGLTTTLGKPDTGLSFPAGDSAMLAQCIRRIFENDELAVKFGRNARTVARKRHDPSRIVRQNLDCYTELAPPEGSKISRSRR